MTPFFLVLSVVAVLATPVVLYVVWRTKKQRRASAEPEFDLDDEP